MNKEGSYNVQVDPARNEPFEARTGNCTCGGVAPEPDSVEDDMRMLRRLAQLGMELTELTVEQVRQAVASAPTPAAKAPDDRFDLKYHRLSRSVRLTITLRDKFRTEGLKQERHEAFEHGLEERKRKERQKKQLERLVAQAIEHQTQVEFDQLVEINGRVDQRPVDHARKTRFEALSDRIEEDDIEQDLDRCPTGELVERMCRDIGVEAALEIWRISHWAREEARLKTPGSPFAAPPAPEEAKPAEAEPEGPPDRRFDRTQPLTEEQQRAEAERNRANYHSRL